MSRQSPDSCQSMAELRPQIDALDAELIALLAERMRYIDRAVTLKQTENLPARITNRVDEVLDNVRQEATTKGFDPDLAETLWRQLIEWSIAREAKHIPE